MGYLMGWGVVLVGIPYAMFYAVSPGAITTPSAAKRPNPAHFKRETLLCGPYHLTTLISRFHLPKPTKATS